jgi:hypothetical protein
MTNPILNGLINILEESKTWVTIALEK